MYRRRGSSQNAAGVLLLSVINSGDDQNFFLNFSTPVLDSDISSLADITIDGEEITVAVQDDTDTLSATLANPVNASGNWVVSGPFFATTPLLFPQSGSY